MRKFSCDSKLSLDCGRNTFYQRVLSGLVIAIAFFTLLITVRAQVSPRDQDFPRQRGHNIPLTPSNPEFFRPNNFPRNKELTNNKIPPSQRVLASPTAGRLDSSFNPTLQTYPGQVEASAVQADGKIIIGGHFSVINGIPMRNLARFNVDGTLDASFNVNVNSNVTALAIQPDGKIIVGGYFSSINNIDSSSLARLNSDGTLDASFVNSSYVFGPSDITIQPDGKIITVGYTLEIIRLNSNGSPDNSFVASVNGGDINTIAMQSDGKILIGGFFTSVNNVPVINGIARLNTDGSLDTSFNAGGLLPFINDLILQPDGKILVAGNSFFIKGNQFNGVVRLNPNGSLDNSFDTEGGANGNVRSIALLSNGKIVIGGSFSSYNGVAKNSIALLSSNGALDPAFNGNFNSGASVSIVSALPNNKIFAGGFFSSYNGVSRDTGVRLNADGSLDSSLMLTSFSPADIATTLAQPDGKILVGGYFNRINGASTGNSIIRLNADGTVDSGFNVGSGADSAIYAMALQPDGKILIGGFFNSFNGVNHNAIARLNNDGSLDTSFNLPVNLYGGLLSLVLQPNGKIIVAGYFSIDGGTSYPQIARLNADGSVDSSFNPGTGANNQINEVVLQPDGKILVGGYFNQFNEVSKYGIVRLNTDGSIDTSFVSLATQNTTVQAIALQPDGKILIGGQIFNAGNSVNGIVRLNADGSFDSSFGNASEFVQSFILDIALQPNGKILIGGFINSANGIPLRNLARLNSDGSLDTNFDIVADDAVRNISLTNNGQKAIISGYFTTIDGVPRANLARIFLETSANARTLFDFDGDGRTDYAVFRPANAVWYLARSTQGFYATPFGFNTDKLTPADYDGDGKTDVSVFRDGTWYILQSSNNLVRTTVFGQAGDVPVPADYDGDGKADLAVFRQGVWYFLNSSNNQFRSIQFGVATDKPVEADYDGDGKTDIAVYRSGAWYELQSSDNSLRVVNFGIASDKPIPADFDGDGKADQAVYRDGTWYLNRSTQGVASVQFGFASDKPIVADYDGDGRADLAVWRPSNGTFYSINTSNNQFISVQWGTNGDAPINAAYLP